jgi:myo-inositol-1(or 4)-monophosphatase
MAFLDVNVFLILTNNCLVQIDGTTNFSSGIPLNMPSIAAAYNGIVVVAVLNDPHRDELFTAVRGKGAHLNGEAIQVGLEESLGDAVVGMESPAGEASLQQTLQGIVPLMPKVRTIRMLGSSAVFLPWVANGRLTAYWTPDECAWDIAAGSLVVQEAGGKVRRRDAIYRIKHFAHQYPANFAPHRLPTSMEMHILFELVI